MDQNLLFTSLHSNHKKLKAKLLPFAGFEMPIQYSSIKEEVFSVRNEVGIFDVSHMGEFFVSGKEAEDFVDHVITSDFKNLPIGKAVYSLICREDGTAVDDLIAYKISRERVLICVNASNMEKDFNHLSTIFKNKNFKCSLENRSADFSLVALQGPKAFELMIQAELLSKDEEKLFGYYEIKQMSGGYSGEVGEIFIARTGYTGEDGFEIFASHKVILKLWELFLKLGATPCGLAARDVLRLEVCYPLFGHEINDHLTPLDSGLKWCVKYRESGFVGQDALKNYQAKYGLVKLTQNEGVPRQGYKVIDEDGIEIGNVVSGTLSPVLNKGIATALIDKEFLPLKKRGKRIFIVIRDKRYECQLSEKAFVIGGHK